MALPAKVHLNVAYVPNSEVSGHTLDLYEPVEASSGKSPFPLVIYIHGGGWTERDKQDYAHIGEACAAQKICCAILNYRLSPLEVPEGSEDHFKHPKHTEDCAMAFLYLYEHAYSYHYDTSRVIVVGHSAGGFMAALLQFEGHFRDIWIRGGKGLKICHWVGLQGIYDLPSILSDFGTDYLRYMIAPAFGWDTNAHKTASPKQILASRFQSAPLDTPPSPPWTLIWSNRDTMVNLRQSEEFEKELQKLKIKTSHLILEPESDMEGSHHGVTQIQGFSRYIMPIISDIVSQNVH
jgi:acetyl esterase/lipase